MPDADGNHSFESATAALPSRCGRPATQTVTKTFSKRGVSETWARKIESAIEQGEIVETSRHTLAEAIHRYKDEPGCDLNAKEKNTLAGWSKELANAGCHRCVAPTSSKRATSSARQNPDLVARSHQQRSTDTSAQSARFSPQRWRGSGSTPIRPNSASDREQPTRAAADRR